MGQQQPGRRNPLSVKLRFKNETQAEFIAHHARNISRTGLFVRTRDPIEEGTALKFDMQLRSGQTVLHGVGRVAWRRTAGDSHHPPGMGIKFIKMDPDSRALVDRIVASRGGAPSRYEAGLPASDSVPPGSAGTPSPTNGPSPSSKRPFFPDSTPPEERSEDEDTTEVRHMTEFLAQALTEGGADARTTAEAQARARQARLRDEAVYQQEQRARGSRPARHSHPPEAAISIAPDPEPSAPRAAPSWPAFEDEKETAPYPSPPRAELEASASREPGREPPASSGDLRQPSAPSPPPAPEPSAARQDAAESVSPVSPAMRAPSLSEPGQAEPARRGWGPMVWLPLALATLGLLVGGYLYVTRPRPKAAPLAPAAEQAPAAADSTGKQSKEPPARVPPAEPAAAEDTQSEAEKTAPDEAETEKQEPAARAKQHAAVEVRTEPAGASLYIDDKLHARSPATLRLPVGRAVTLRTRLRGYEDIERTLEPGRVDEPLELELRPLPYVLEVRTQPPGATIRVLSKTATSPASIEVGRLVGPIGVEASKPGFESARKMVSRSAFDSRNDHMHGEVQLRLREKKAAAAETPSSPEPQAPQPDDPEPQAPQPDDPEPNVPEAEPQSPKEPENTSPEEGEALEKIMSERDLPLNPF